ncbi:hypothetical protein ACJX0J_010803, partial [Zea mays]
VNEMQGDGIRLFHSLSIVFSASFGIRKISMFYITKMLILLHCHVFIFMYFNLSCLQHLEYRLLMIYMFHRSIYVFRTYFLYLILMLIFPLYPHIFLLHTSLNGYFVEINLYINMKSSRIGLVK